MSSALRVRGPDQMRALGRALASHLRAGDVVMLCGPLGAGKTTLAQGIGAGLGVRGRVSSPTFVIARAHPSAVGGPAMIHVDAYRIEGLDDLETLDLDSTLDDSVTVVEWGEGKTESLSAERLEIRIEVPESGEARRSGAAVDLSGIDRGVRLVQVRPHGSRWGAELQGLAREAGLARRAG